MGSFKNALAVLSGVLMSVALLAAMEGFFRLNRVYGWIEKPASSSRPVVGKSDWDASVRLRDEVKGFLKRRPWTPKMSKEDGWSVRPTADFSRKGNMPHTVLYRLPRSPRRFQSEVFGAQGEIVYSVRFTVDGFERRVTPDPAKPRAQILMLGDSYTLGEGVEDFESAPWILGERRPETKVYNLGIAGGGPGSVLHELQRNQAGRLDDIPVKPSVILYTYMDHHLERLLARSSAVRPPNDWILRHPYYAEEGGEVVLKGTLGTDRPWRNALYRALHETAMADFFNLVWPPFFTDSDFRFFAKVLLEMETAALKRYGPGSRFFFVVYPGDRFAAYGPMLSKAAAAAGLSVLDYSRYDLEEVTGGLENIPGDGHPSPPVQAVFGFLLDRDLPDLPF